VLTSLHSAGRQATRRSRKEEEEEEEEVPPKTNFVASGDATFPRALHSLRERDSRVLHISPNSIPAWIAVHASVVDGSWDVEPAPVIAL
jgi:hypothetical protein